MRVLFICTANQCRSPMAERLAWALGVDAESAGVNARPNSPMVSEAEIVLRELGGDGTDFRSRRVTPEMVAEADMVLAMTEEHRDAVLAAAPLGLNKTFTLKEAVRVIRDSGASTVEEMARNRVASQRFESDDIEDPIGQDLQTFRESIDEINRHLRYVLGTLVPGLDVPELQQPHYPLPVELPLVDEPGGTEVPLKTQLTRFVLVGGLSACVDFGLYALLLFAGLQVNIAKSISFVAGTTTAYFLNRQWTFKAEPSRARFAAVIVLYALTFALQVGINWVCYQGFPNEWWRVPTAFVIAQGTATIVNFVVQRSLIFKLR